MFETFGFEELTPLQASLYFALAIGIAFGVLAEVTRFCLRRALVGQDRVQARGVWMMALAVALIGTQASVFSGLISFEGHRFLSSDLPILSLVLGGLAFGAGMVLTRGCASRLTVLAGSGNLRAALVVMVFAVVAHATLKGVFAPAASALASLTLPLGEWTSLATLPGGALPYVGLLSVLLLFTALRSGVSAGQLTLAALIGLLVTAAWVGTGFILFDEFDPITTESLSLTAPATAALFYTIAGTAVDPGFGIGLVGGILAGALVSSLIAGRFQWQSFESPAQTGRYMAGAALMGVGGVLAGGCTLGAGLSGLPTLGTSAIVAFSAIVAGARLTGTFLNESASESAAQPARPEALLAE